jgi:small subunit ribosomal protein S11
MSTLKKQKKHIKVGIAVIKSTANNTLVTLTDLLGNTLLCISAGTVGFKGARKTTLYAAQSITALFVSKLGDFGIKTLHIIFRGQGNIKEPLLKTLQHSRLIIPSITDQTALAFNGCRPPKKRRI